MTREEFYLVSHATGKGRISMNAQGERPYDIKLRLEEVFEMYLSKLQQLHKRGRLTISSIKTMVTGGTGGDGQDFLSVWESEAQRKSIGTRYNYLNARNSFVKYLGQVPGFNVTVAEIRKRHDKLLEDGLKKTTVGIYLRACRLIWNVCEKYGYVSRDDYPFGKDEDKVTIPKGATRQECYLDVDQMTELYQCFLEKRYPEDWDTDWREHTHESLGLFLVQYLCNGFNLADAARLVYDDHYFKSGRKSFRFIRKKTKDRSDTEIVIPIIEPCRKYLTRLPKEYIQEAMGHSVMSGTVTDRYIQTYPLARQMEFNSKLLKLGEQIDIMEELQGLTTDQIKALIEMVKKNKSYDYESEKKCIT